MRLYRSTQFLFSSSMVMLLSMLCVLSALRMSAKLMFASSSRAVRELSCEIDQSDYASQSICAQTAYARGDCQKALRYGLRVKRNYRGIHPIDLVLEVCTKLAR